jgi:flagellin
MEVSLTAGMRETVLSLQSISSIFDTTQTHLATGRAVNTALDDPIKYFSAQNNTFRANGLSTLKSSMNEALQTVQAANNGITVLTSLIKNAIAIANQAQSTSDTAAQQTLLKQYIGVLSQINSAGQDAGYGGKNFLNNGTYVSAGVTTGSDSLTVNFSPTSTNSFITITGTDTTVVGLGLSIGGVTVNATSVSNAVVTISENSTTGVITATMAAAQTVGWTSVSTDVTNLNNALTSLQTDAKTLSTNNAIVQARIDFTMNMINTLQQGADKLTLADMNQEGANMLSLQTQQALATNSLRLASQASQSVLRLFQ